MESQARGVLAPEGVAAERILPVATPAIFAWSIVFAAAVAAIHLAGAIWVGLKDGSFISISRAIFGVLLILAGISASYGIWRITHSIIGAIWLWIGILFDSVYLTAGQTIDTTWFALPFIGLAIALASNRNGLVQPWSIAPILFAALFEPSSAWLSIPLALMMLFRGHVYAGPRHFLIALGYILASFGAAIASVTLASGRSILEFNILEAPRVFDGFVQFQNPLTILGGTIAILGVTGLLLGRTIHGIRIRRIPGRVQIRFQDGPLPSELTRGAWVAVLALSGSILTVPLLVALMGFMVRTQSDESPGFAILLSVGILFLVLAPLAQFYKAILGLDGALESVLDLLGFLYN